MRITNDVEYGGFQLTGGARLGRPSKSSRMGDDCCGAMFSTITHPRGGLRNEKALYPGMRENAVLDGANHYLRASGEEVVVGQAPGVIYSK